MHLFSTECKIIQSNNKVLPSKNPSTVNNAQVGQIVKAQAQFYGRKYLGKTVYGVLGWPFERVTDFAFERMR